MNSRRRILQFLGLGSLFATAGGVTINQARAAKGLEPLSAGYVGKLVEVPERHRSTFPPSPPRRWQHRIVWVCFKDCPEQGVAEIMDRETADGESELVSLSEAYGAYCMVFRKRVFGSTTA